MAEDAGRDQALRRALHPGSPGAGCPVASRVSQRGPAGRRGGCPLESLDAQDPPVLRPCPTPSQPDPAWSEAWVSRGLGRRRGGRPSSPSAGAAGGAALGLVGAGCKGRCKGRRCAGARADADPSCRRPEARRTRAECRGGTGSRSRCSPLARARPLAPPGAARARARATQNGGLSRCCSHDPHGPGPVHVSGPRTADSDPVGFMDGPAPGAGGPPSRRQGDTDSNGRA
jgi:hypothetical protein